MALAAYQDRSRCVIIGMLMIVKFLIVIIFLPPASAVEVIESELWVCVSVCVCQHSNGQTVWPMTLMNLCVSLNP